MTKPILALSSLLMTGSLLAGTAPSSYTAPTSAPEKISLLNYNSVEFGWVHTEWDNSLLGHSDGVNATISYSPVQHLYLIGSGAWEWVDVAGESADLWRANAGLGAYVSLGGGIDFVAEGGALFYGIQNARIESQDDASAYARPHFRGRWGRFEAQAGAVWANLDLTNEWAGFARAYFAVAENIDLSVGVSGGSEELTFNAGVRFRY